MKVRLIFYWIMGIAVFAAYSYWSYIAVKALPYELVYWMRVAGYAVAALSFVMYVASESAKSMVKTVREYDLNMPTGRWFQVRLWFSTGTGRRVLIGMLILAIAVLLPTDARIWRR